MLQFDEPTHTYTLDGKELISVTQLLKKHGLSQDFSFVAPDVLERAANRGTLIHKEIQDFITSGEIGFTDELMQFIEMGMEGIESSERMVYNDVIAGTVDIVGNGFVEDVKTGSTLDIEAVRYQVGLYVYLITMGVKTDYESFEQYVRHLGKKPKRIKLMPMPYDELHSLVEAERKGEMFTLTQEVPGWLIGKLKKLDDEIKEKEKELAKQKAILMNMMKKRGVQKFKNDVVSISFTGAYVRYSVDTKKLQEEKPEIYEEYKKSTKVRENVRLTFAE